MGGRKFRHILSRCISKASFLDFIQKEQNSPRAGVFIFYEACSLLLSISKFIIFFIVFTLCRICFVFPYYLGLNVMKYLVFYPTVFMVRQFFSIMGGMFAWFLNGKRLFLYGIFGYIFFFVFPKNRDLKFREIFWYNNINRSSFLEKDFLKYNGSFSQFRHLKKFKPKKFLITEDALYRYVQAHRVGVHNRKPHFISFSPHTIYRGDNFVKGVYSFYPNKHTGNSYFFDWFVKKNNLNFVKSSVEAVFELNYGNPFKFSTKWYNNKISNFRFKNQRNYVESKIGDYSDQAYSGGRFMHTRRGYKVLSPDVSSGFLNLKNVWNSVVGFNLWRNNYFYPSYAKQGKFQEYQKLLYFLWKKRRPFDYRSMLFQSNRIRPNEFRRAFNVWWDERYKFLNYNLNFYSFFKKRFAAGKLLQTNFFIDRDLNNIFQPPLYPWLAPRFWKESINYWSKELGLSLGWSWGNYWTKRYYDEKSRYLNKSFLRLNKDYNYNMYLANMLATFKEMYRVGVARFTLFFFFYRIVYGQVFSPFLNIKRYKLLRAFFNRHVPQRTFVPPTYFFSFKNSEVASFFGENFSESYQEFYSKFYNHSQINFGPERIKKFYIYEQPFIFNWNNFNQFKNYSNSARRIELREERISRLDSNYNSFFRYTLFGKESIFTSLLNLTSNTLYEAFNAERLDELREAGRRFDVDEDNVSVEVNPMGVEDEPFSDLLEDTDISKRLSYAISFADSSNFLSAGNSNFRRSWLQCMHLLHSSSFLNHQAFFGYEPTTDNLQDALFFNVYAREFKRLPLNHLLNSVEALNGRWLKIAVKRKRKKRPNEMLHSDSLFFLTKSAKTDFMSLLHNINFYNGNLRRLDESRRMGKLIKLVVKKGDKLEKKIEKGFLNGPIEKGIFRKNKDITIKNTLWSFGKDKKNNLNDWVLLQANLKKRFQEKAAPNSDNGAAFLDEKLFQIIEQKAFFEHSAKIRQTKSGRQKVSDFFLIDQPFFGKKLRLPGFLSKDSLFQNFLHDRDRSDTGRELISPKIKQNSNLVAENLSAKVESTMNSTRFKLSINKHRKDIIESGTEGFKKSFEKEESTFLNRIKEQTRYEILYRKLNRIELYKQIYPIRKRRIAKKFGPKHENGGAYPFFIPESRVKQHKSNWTLSSGLDHMYLVWKNRKLSPTIYSPVRKRMTACDYWILRRAFYKGFLTTSDVYRYLKTSSFLKKLRNIENKILDFIFNVLPSDFILVEAKYVLLHLLLSFSFLDSFLVELSNLFSTDLMFLKNFFIRLILCISDQWLWFSFAYVKVSAGVFVNMFFDDLAGTFMFYSKSFELYNTEAYVPIKKKSYRKARRRYFKKHAIGRTKRLFEYSWGLSRSSERGEALIDDFFAGRLKQFRRKFSLQNSYFLSYNLLDKWATKVKYYVWDPTPSGWYKKGKMGGENIKVTFDTLNKQYKRRLLNLRKRFRFPSKQFGKNKIRLQKLKTIFGDTRRVELKNYWNQKPIFLRKLPVSYFSKIYNDSYITEKRKNFAKEISANNFKGIKKFHLNYEKYTYRHLFLGLDDNGMTDRRKKKKKGTAWWLKKKKRLKKRGHHHVNLFKFFKPYDRLKLVKSEDYNNYSWRRPVIYHFSGRIKRRRKYFARRNPFKHFSKYRRKKFIHSRIHTIKLFPAKLQYSFFGLMRYNNDFCKTLSFKNPLYLIDSKIATNVFSHPEDINLSVEANNRFFKFYTNSLRRRNFPVKFKYFYFFQYHRFLKSRQVGGEYLLAEPEYNWNSWNFQGEYEPDHSHAPSYSYTNEYDIEGAVFRGRDRLRRRYKGTKYLQPSFKELDGHKLKPKFHKFSYSIARHKKTKLKKRKYLSRLKDSLSFSTYKNLFTAFHERRKRKVKYLKKHRRHYYKLLKVKQQIHLFIPFSIVYTLKQVFLLPIFLIKNYFFTSIFFYFLTSGLIIIILSLRAAYIDFRKQVNKHYLWSLQHSSFTTSFKLDFHRFKYVFLKNAYEMIDFCPFLMRLQNLISVCLVQVMQFFKLQLVIIKLNLFLHFKEILSFRSYPRNCIFILVSWIRSTLIKLFKLVFFFIILNFIISILKNYLILTGKYITHLPSLLIVLLFFVMFIWFLSICSSKFVNNFLTSPYQAEQFLQENSGSYELEVEEEEIYDHEENDIEEEQESFDEFPFFYNEAQYANNLYDEVGRSNIDMHPDDDHFDTHIFDTYISPHWSQVFIEDINQDIVAEFEEEESLKILLFTTQLFSPKKKSRKKFLYKYDDEGWIYDEEDSEEAHNAHFFYYYFGRSGHDEKYNSHVIDLASDFQAVAEEFEEEEEWDIFNIEYYDEESEDDSDLFDSIDFGEERPVARFYHDRHFENITLFSLSGTAIQHSEFYEFFKEQEYGDIYIINELGWVNELFFDRFLVDLVKDDTYMFHDQEVVSRICAYGSETVDGSSLESNDFRSLSFSLLKQLAPSSVFSHTYFTAGLIGLLRRDLVFVESEFVIDEYGNKKENLINTSEPLKDYDNFNLLNASWRVQFMLTNATLLLNFNPYKFNLKSKLKLRSVSVLGYEMYNNKYKRQFFRDPEYYVRLLSLKNYPELTYSEAERLWAYFGCTEAEWNSVDKVFKGKVITPYDNYDTPFAICALVLGIYYNKLNMVGPNSRRRFSNYREDDNVVFYLYPRLKKHEMKYRDGKSTEFLYPEHKYEYNPMLFLFDTVSLIFNFLNDNLFFKGKIILNNSFLSTQSTEALYGIVKKLGFSIFLYLGFIGDFIPSFNFAFSYFLNNSSYFIVWYFYFKIMTSFNSVVFLFYIYLDYLIGTLFFDLTNFYLAQTFFFLLVFYLIKLVFIFIYLIV